MAESDERTSAQAARAAAHAGPTRRAVLAPVLTGGVLAGLGASPWLARAASADTTDTADTADTDVNGRAETQNDSDKPGNDLFVHNVRVFDGERTLDNATILVLDGRIVAVGRFDRANRRSVNGILVPPGIATCDGRARTLLPGLVDAHVHSDPDFRTEAPRFGVTTELDMFGHPAVLSAAKRQRRSLDRTATADLWGSGVGVTVPGGHPQVEGWKYPTVTEGTDVDAFVGARLREGSDYVKIIVEDGNGTLPSLTPAQVRTATTAAHRRGKLAVAHAERLAHVHTALAAGVDGITHVAIDEPMDEDLITCIRRAGIFAVPTVTVVDCGAGADDALRDPTVEPYLSELQHYTLANRPPRQCRRQYRENATTNTGRLHRAGVPVLAGTDAPLPGTANGVSLLWALEYLTEAGLSPIDALTAATSAPTHCFGLGDRGRIRPGCRADLVLVEGDPTTDIRQLRNIARVWKNGFPIDRTPVRSDNGGLSS